MASRDPLTLLETHGLRATRPRVLVANMLFGDKENRHVTAEWVADRLEEAGERVALATVYNTLHHFADVGLLRQIHAGDRGVIIFDTNTEPHHHFFDEKTKMLTDIPADAVQVENLPEPPKGAKTVGWELIIRVR